MAQITFHHADGREEKLEVDEGTTVMRAGVSAGVEGIIGECGGQAMCATCHVYVRDEFLDRLPEISEDEDEMLDEALAPRDAEHSRLGCQLRLEGALEVLEVDVPDAGR
ncbi:MAG: 2Fe-2S iron-sulfur cluster-binding protein [Leucobacter sp.]